MSEMLSLTPSPALSALVWFLLLSLVLYLARTPAHQALRALRRAVRNLLRLSARYVMDAEQRLARRNREVLLEQGRVAAARRIEREFERVEHAIATELAQYPALQRELREKITAIEEDYQKSVDIPPEPPPWTNAVDTIAKLPANSEPMVARVLEDIHASMVKANDLVIEEFRRASRERHLLLVKMMPLWRQMVGLLQLLDKNIDSLRQRAQTVDQLMQHYQALTANSDHSVRMLSSAAAARFLVAGLGLAIAAAGAMINYNLIAHPMREMADGNTLLLGFATADTAALVVVSLQLALGVYLIEALRISRLFPAIGALGDGLRLRLAWAAFLLLLALAGIEAGLIYIREPFPPPALLEPALLEDAGMAMAANNHWLTAAIHMGLGIVLPLALAFTAIPLESFLHTGRTILGWAGIGLLRILTWSLRLLANLAWHLGALLLHGYDLLAFAPLWIERTLRERRQQPAAPAPAQAADQ